jgi:hypothetical protein
MEVYILQQELILYLWFFLSLKILQPRSVIVEFENVCINISNTMTL